MKISPREPQVFFDNSLSQNHTIMEVMADDKIGFTTHN